MTHATKKTEFLNVDLDIVSDIDISSLLLYVAPSVLILNRTITTASLELRESENVLGDTLLKFVYIVQSLPKREKEIWNQCKSRTVNIGIKGGNIPYAQCFMIPRETVSLLACINVEIIFTVYAVSE